MNTVEHNPTNLNSDKSNETENSTNNADNANLSPCNCKKVESKEDLDEIIMLDDLTNSPAVFLSQQMGDPDITQADKKKIAEDLLHKNPVSFLIKFGEYLTEAHLNFLLKKYNTYEVEYYVKTLKLLLNDHNRKILRRNRRYEAMKKMELEGNYFSEAEMEKREPLLYHQMVGQYLSKKDKLLRNRQAQDSAIPTFSKFLMDKMERDELNELRKIQQKKEEEDLQNEETSSEDEMNKNVIKVRWGENWEEAPFKKESVKRTKKKLKVCICAKEKDLLLQEFKSIMQSNFLNGKDIDFNYFEVDYNSEYDSIDIRSQDEEEKYFDEETCDNSVCTDTGIEDY